MTVIKAVIRNSAFNVIIQVTCLRDYSDIRVIDPIFLRFYCFFIHRSFDPGKLRVNIITITNATVPVSDGYSSDLSSRSCQNRCIKFSQYPSQDKLGQILFFSRVCHTSVLCLSIPNMLKVPYSLCSFHSATQNSIRITIFHCTDA